MPNRLTTKYSSYLASRLLDAVNDKDTDFFVYTGVHGDVIGSVPIPSDDYRDTQVDAYRNMIMGKRVLPTDVVLLARNIPYEANKVFAMYDDMDQDMFTKDFFCYVDEISFLHMYKCLDNNFNSPSTVEPAFNFVTIQSNYIFQTSDGYVWKYMYSISGADRDRFATANYFPIKPNANVANAAVRGSIDTILIQQNDFAIPGGGKKYDNYVVGTFSANQLRVNSNNYLYEIANTNINYTRGFYTGCLIYLSGGVGTGQYRTIDDYFTNANGNFIVISSPFDINPVNGTTWEIYPHVAITGSGNETVNAIARAIINATGSNSVFKVEMLDRGAGYDYARASIVANTVVSRDVNFIPAVVRPIYSPYYGHGSDAVIELGCDAVEFNMKFANNEGGTLLDTNRFQQIGLLQDPLFANVNVQIANAVGTFAKGEPVYKFSQLMRINSNVSISNTSPEITGHSMVLSSASVITSGNNGTYVPTDVLTVVGGTYFEPAQIEVLTTIVRTAAINNHGTGYAACTVFTANISVGTAVTNATVSVTTNSSGICNTISIVNPGSYSANPPFLSNTTPLGGTGSGLTVSLTMGVGTITIYDTGAYAVIPVNLTNVPISNVGSGAGAQILLSFTPTLTADFVNQLSVGDYIYISAPDNSQQQLTTVNSINNSASLIITSNGLFSCAAANMYKPTITTTAVVQAAANSDHVLLDSVAGELFYQDFLVGGWSSAKAQVNAVMRNDVMKDLGSFIQLYKYNISMLSGGFVQNEIVYQGDELATANATALVHSVEIGACTSILYTSNQVGQFTTNTFLNGANSLALASMNAPYAPELEFGSGQVLYIENTDPVTRTPESTETSQLILTF